MSIVDISGNWHDNQIPLCKWIDTESQDVELELEANKGNSFTGIVMVMACVEKEIHGVDFTSRYQWKSRNLLESSACSGVTCELYGYQLRNIGFHSHFS